VIGKHSLTPVTSLPCDYDSLKNVLANIQNSVNELRSNANASTTDLQYIVMIQIFFLVAKILRNHFYADR
jgi:hypothetical protein